MKFKISVLYSGFPGKLTNAGLGWGAVAQIQAETHNILVDTGGPGIRGTLKGMLSEHGLDFGDIDIVALTHLHWDHAYNIDYFPQASFVLTKTEWQDAGKIDPKDIFMEEKAVSFLRTMKVQFIEKDGQEIIPGVSGVFLPGHTSGSMGVLVNQSETENWLFTGDACKNRAELKSEDSGQAYDMNVATETIRKIKRISTRVLPGHDGWITINKNGDLVPEGGNDVTLVFSENLTINGGLTKITIHLD